MPKDVRIAIAVACDVVREGLRSILDHQGLAVVAPEGAEPEPDIVLASLPDTESGGAALVDRLHRQFPSARLVLLAGPMSRDTLDLARTEAVHAILPSRICARALCAAIELVAAGERHVPPPWEFDGRDAPADGAMQSLRATRPPGPDRSAATPRRHLSVRESEVLDCLTHGHPNKVIARELSISEATVKVHIKAILRKTGLRNRTEVALLAAQSAGHA